MNTTDERRGLPSASGIERLSLCPGSWNLERTLPPLPETEDAASGARIHLAVETGDCSSLNDDEAAIWAKCNKLRREVVERVFEDRTLESEFKEERLWLDGRIGNRFSGKADYIAWAGDVALILDYKTGRNDVTTADGNLQLRSLTPMVDLSGEDFSRIVVGIIAPWQKEPISLCAYTREDLARAREWLVGVLDAADKPDAPRVPGEKQCRYCRAKAVCPEARQVALSVAKEVLAMAPANAVPDDVRAIAAHVSGEQLGGVLNQVPFIESIFDAFKAEAKKRLDVDKDSVPGWRLKEGATREVITDPQTVFQRFTDAGGNAGQFMPCVQIKKGELKETCKAMSGFKGKQLDGLLDSLLDGCTEEKQNAPSLERVKE